jgi:hypothetical protein
MQPRLARAVEHGARERQHRRDGRHVARDAEALGREQRRREHRVQREVRHAPAGLGQLPGRGERPERVEQLNRPREALGGRRVHVVAARVCTSVFILLK